MDDRECEVVFDEGLIGLPAARRFHLAIRNDSAIYLLRCLDINGFNVPVIDPFLVDSQYKPNLPRRVAGVLAVKQSGDLLLLAVTTAPTNGTALANLAAPLAINVSNRRGVQIILDGNRYSSRAAVRLASEPLQTGRQPGTGGPNHARTESQTG